MKRDLTGSTIGSFRIEAELGRGAAGIVYRARDTALNRPVALKILHRPHARDPVFLKRFYREAQAVAQLNHPNIVTVYALGEENDDHFIALEYIDGKSLADVIAEAGRLDTERALEFSRQIASALSAAHERGIIHRDIKPHNIMITDKGVAKVMDFGIALVSREHAARLTSQGQLLGTPAYMSPEQCEGSDVDQRSDVYAVGAVMYSMLAGRRPFDTRDPIQAILKIVSEEPPDIRKLNGEIPEALACCIERAMKKKPDARYQTADELAAAIGDVIAELHSATDDPVVKVMPSSDAEADLDTGPRPDHAVLRQAIAYYTGTIGHTDEEMARELFVQAIGGERNPVAELWHADLYNKGACKFERQPKRAQVIARAAFDSADLLAKRGDVEALYIVGRAYQRGLGVARDEMEAAALFRKAADKGHAHALMNLGVMFDHGQGVEQDGDEAVRLWKLAADAGHAWAMNNLAMRLSSQGGSSKAFQEGLRLYEKAAERGYTKAMYNLGMLHFNMGEDERCRAEAVRWWEEAAWLGDALAQSALEQIGRR